MHGKILEITVCEGQTVEKGARLLVLEAMKMQHDILAPADGVIQDIHQQAGHQTAAGDLLVEIDVVA